MKRRGWVAVILVGVTLLAEGCTGTAPQARGHPVTASASTSPPVPAVSAHKVGQVLGYLTVNGAPLAFTVAFGSVWVLTDQNGVGVVERYDRVTRVFLAQVTVGSSPVGVAAGFGSLWVANHDDGTVSRIDPTTNTLTATVPVGPGPTNMAMGGGFLWVGNDDDTVAQVDPATNRRRQLVQVGKGAKFRGVAALDGSIWTANSDGSVDRLDWSTGRILATIPIARCCDGDVLLAGGDIWVSNPSQGNVYRINPADDHVTGHLQVGAAGHWLALAGDVLWVGHGQSALVTWHSIRTGRTLGRLQLLGFAGPVRDMGDGSVWAEDRDDSELVLIGT